jgi:hypothetical protein
MAALLDCADQALLPALYREVGAAFGASPTALGFITLCRVLVMARSRRASAPRRATTKRVS